MNRYLLFFLLLLFSGVTFISCSKERSFETGSNLKAKGSLKNDQGNCYPPSVHGSYVAGVAVTTASKVDISVNVTVPGSYSITTDTINGFMFKAAGSFATTGVQTIELLASGKPITAQMTSFNISFDSTNCSFTVDVTDSSSGGSAGIGYLSDTAWRFSENTRGFHGYIDTAYVLDTSFAGIPVKVLFIQGATALKGDSVLLLSMVMQGNAITPGTYPSTTSGLFQFLGSYDLTNIVYSAKPTDAGVVTNITIQSYNATTRIVKGIFAGNAKNKSTSTVNISNGKFEAKIN